MPDERTQELINQLTLRKLAFARELLREHDVAISGNRDKIVGRLNKAVDEGKITPDAILALLNELDAWGDQRVKLASFEPRFLASYADADEVRARIREAGMEHFFNRSEIDLRPPGVLAPMVVDYEELGDDRLLRVTAAKTRLVERPAKDFPELNSERDVIASATPDEGIVYKPFRRERQKVVSFAEVNLTTGFVIISTTLLKHGRSYRAEFEELLSVFEPLVPLGAANTLLLYGAVHEIRQLPHEQVRVYSRESRSPVGGSVNLRSHSSKTDLRTDPALMRADALFGAEDGAHCNCRWQPVSGLTEEVHTHVYAPTGEVSIMGQITESSARHVLQRIRALN